MKKSDNNGMRGWVLCVALCAALAVTPMWAQRGGGGRGGVGGGHGFSGGGFAARGGAISGYRASPGYARAYGAYRSWNGGAWRGNGYGWRGNGGRGYPYRPYRWSWRGGYPWWWGWGYAGWAWYPYWGWYGGTWYDASDYYPDDYQPYTYAPSAYSAQTYPSYAYAPPPPPEGQSYATPNELEQLQNEVNQLRAQQPQSSGAAQKAQVHGETALVYRNGRTEEVDNYAIVGKTLWIFNQERAKKVPLAELNLPATKRANEDRGVEFVVPNPSR